jgi:hypothetical protein
MPGGWRGCRTALFRQRYGGLLMKPFDQRKAAELGRADVPVQGEAFAEL